MKLLPRFSKRFRLPCGRQAGFTARKDKGPNRQTGGMGRVARFTPHRAATQDASNGEKAAG